MTWQTGSVGYGELVEFFFRTHDPTTVDRQGPDRGSRESQLLSKGEKAVRLILMFNLRSGLVEYRSALFYTTPEQKEIAEKVTAEVQEKQYVNPHQPFHIIYAFADRMTAPIDSLKGRTIVTQLAPLGKWHDAEGYHQNYLFDNPSGYQCPTHRMYW